MKINEHAQMMRWLTRPSSTVPGPRNMNQGGRIGFQRGSVASEIGSDRTIGGLTKKERIAQGLEKGRVSINIDPYTKIVNEHNKAIKEALDAKDASKLPKSFAQTLREKGLKDGTYHHLVRSEKIPKARDVSLNRFDLANEVINDYNNQLKFMEKEAVLKKANFTPKEIKVLGAQTFNKYPYRVSIADKAQDKVRKAFFEFFGNINNPNLETAYNNFYNPRELLSKATGLNAETVSRVNLKAVDPQAYEVYKRLGNADIQKILNGDVTKGFFGSSLGDLKKYINEDIAKGKKPFQEFMYAGKGKTPTQLIKEKLDPEGVKTKRINPLKKGSGWDIAHSVKAGLLDPDKRGPQMKYESPDTLYPLKQELNRQRFEHTFRDTKHTAAENALTKIHNDRMKLMEQVEGDNFRVIPGKEREFAELQAKGKKIAREFSYTDELFGTEFKGLPGKQKQVRGTVNFQIFNPDEKGIYKPDNTTLVGGDTEKSLAKGLPKELRKKDIKKFTKPDLKKFTDNTVQIFRDNGILLKQLCSRKGSASGGRIGYAAGTPTVACGREQLQKLLFKGGGTAGERSLVQKIISGGGRMAIGMLNPKELLRLKNLVGPGALGLMAAYEAGSITDDVLRLNKPLDEALAGNWLTKSFLPYSEEFAKQKNLLQSGKLTGPQREYALEMMKMEEFMKEGKRIEEMEATQLVDQGGVGMIDGTPMVSTEDLNKAYQGLFERFSRLKPYAYEEGVTGRSLENEAAMNEYIDRQTAKTGEYIPEVSEDKFRLDGQRKIKRDEDYDFASKSIWWKPQRLENRAPRPTNMGRGPMTEKGRMKLDYHIPGYTPYDKAYTPSDEEILNIYKQQGYVHPRFGQLEPGEGTKVRMGLAMQDGNRSIFGSKFSEGGITGLRSKYEYKK